MRDLVLEDKKYVLNLYKRINIKIVNGSGAYLYDDNNNKYLDMYTGIAVNSLGHDEELKNIIMSCASKFSHLSNFFVNKATVNLAKILVENTFASKVFFCNSGTEANEAAIKLCRKYGRSFNNDKIQILTAHNSFHGRTLGALSLTGMDKYKKQFGDLLSGVKHFEYNNIEDFKNTLSNKTCAVFLEIIQGSGGIINIKKEFIENIVKLSKEYNFLIVIDEIQTGLGRTGKFLAYEHFEFEPHILTLAKSLGGGVPLGAMLVAKELDNVLVPGDHGSTFGGNPIACAAGEYVVNKVLKKEFLNEINNSSKLLFEELNKLKVEFPNIINEIRGKGLMLGIEVGDYTELIKEKAFEKNMLVNVTNKKILRLLPPLNINKNEISEFLRIFKEILIEIS